MPRDTQSIRTEIFMSAKWITDEIFSNSGSGNVFVRRLVQSAEKPDVHANAHILFRKNFFIGEKNGKYVVRITADDYYKLYINGKFVCSGPVPGYPFHYYYDEADVSGFITQGVNVLAVHTYYQGLINRVWVSGDGRHGLYVSVKDGKGNEVASSDESFLVARHGGYKTHGEIYGWITQFPEDYDSQSDEDGFYDVNFDDALWHNAVAVRDADYRLFARPVPFNVIETLKPVFSEKREDSFFFDFGREISGTLKIKAKGARGAVVTVRQGEETNKDGSVRFDMRCNCRYEEFWTLSGRETDCLEQFLYKGFRYAELSVPYGVEIIEVIAVAEHYPFAKKSFAAESNAKTGDVFRLCRDTLEYGVRDSVIDCPTREKGQYFGDGFYITLSHYALTGDLTLMRKLIADAFLSCRIEPGMLAYAPSSRTDEIAEFPMLIVVLVLFEAVLSGNTDFLEKTYPDVIALMEVYRMRYERENGTVTVGDKWNLVDWPESARDGYDARLVPGEICRDCHAVMNAYVYAAKRAVNRMAVLLKKEEPFDLRSARLVLTEVFYRAEKGLFADRKESVHYSVGTNAFFLLLGLAPDARAEKNIVRLLIERKLDNSNLFTSPVILAALWKYGYEKEALKIIADKKYWKNMIKEGATTTFEAFSKTKKANCSLFHPSFAFPVLFLAEEETGILKKLSDAFFAT